MRFIKWLDGQFTCVKCGHEFKLLSFGFGHCVCPDCYDGEHQFIWPDLSYWLNRLLLKGVKNSQYFLGFSETDSPLCGICELPKDCDDLCCDMFKEVRSCFCCHFCSVSECPHWPKAREEIKQMALRRTEK